MISENIISNIPGVGAMVRIIEATSKTGKSAAMHFHNYAEIIYVENGSISVMNEDTEITAKKGEIVFINSCVPHETYKNVPYSNCALFQFDLSKAIQTPTKDMGKYFGRFISSSLCRMHHFSGADSSRSELEQCLLRILEEQKERKKAYGLYINAELLRIIAFLYRRGIIADELSGRSAKALSKILPALKYLDENFRNEITLRELSAAANLNPNYFCRTFKAATNSTFTEYLNFIRICCAEKLIVAGENTISEISESVGFSSVSYFNRVFRRLNGCTPSSYRKIKYDI